MKILIAPLNWGLGHATRCIPLIENYLQQGHEVVLGGDGDALLRLRKQFPELRYVQLAPLHLTYSRRKRQVATLLWQLPKLIPFSIRDHYQLQVLLHCERFDKVISDNRFGLYSDLCACVYITHQLHICLPRPWRWAEGIAAWLHARIYRRYTEVWVPDFEQAEHSLAGRLSHPTKMYCHERVRYIGPLSRMKPAEPNRQYDVVALLSGLEPQRTLLEQTIVQRYQGGEESVLIVRGKVQEPATRLQHGSITMVSHLPDDELIPYLTGCQHIIARSGYTTLMDMKKLDLLSKVEFLPTPGQPEQEYLYRWLSHGIM